MRDTEIVHLCALEFEGAVWGGASSGPLAVTVSIAVQLYTVNTRRLSQFYDAASRQRQWLLSC